jgi:hypothetical protein
MIALWLLAAAFVLAWGQAVQLSFFDLFGVACRGPDPWMETGPSGELLSSWTRDALGRPLTQSVARSGGGFDAFGWTWDTEWIDKLTEVTDPSGATSWTYGADLGGRTGEPTEVVRSFVGGPTLAWSMLHDVQGQEVERAWPSGAVVRTARGPTGVPLAWEVVTTVTWGWDGTFDDATGEATGWHQRTPSADHVVTRSLPGRPDRLEWTWSNGPTYSVDYQWDPNGWLGDKAPSGVPALAYSYDPRGRIEAIDLSDGTTAEVWEYDAVGNPESVYLAHEGTWTTLAPPSRFSQVGSRVNGTQSDVHLWNLLGQLSEWRTAWETSASQTISLRRRYGFDGVGRLQSVVQDRNNGLVPAWVPMSSANYAYDVDNALVREQHGAATVWRWGSYEKDTRRPAAQQEMERVLPWVRLEGAVPRLALAEPDGRAIWTTQDDGTLKSREVVGAQGVPIMSMNAGSSWHEDGMHGSDPDRTLRVVPFGVRHALHRDGVWMQPEPLLAQGLTEASEKAPSGLLGVYGVGNTNRFADATGMEPVLMPDGTPLSDYWAQRVHGNVSSMATSSQNMLDDTANAAATVATAAATGGAIGVADDVLAGGAILAGIGEKVMSARGMMTALRDAVYELIGRGASKSGSVAAKVFADTPGLTDMGACRDCAKSLKGAFDAAGVESTHVRMSVPEQFGIGRGGTPITANGTHDFVDAGGTVFDNLTPGGLPKDDYFKGLEFTSQPTFKVDPPLDVP